MRERILEFVYEGRMSRPLRGARFIFGLEFSPWLGHGTCIDAPSHALAFYNKRRHENV